MVRRVLPWVLMPKFRNVLTQLDIDPNRKGDVVIRNIDLYVTDNVGIYVPGASTFLSVPYLKYDTEINEEEKTVSISSNDGFVAGFMPNGRYSKFLAKTIDENDGPIVLKYEGESLPDFAISIVARNVYRLHAGKYFAAKIKKYMEKLGVEFDKTRTQVKITDVLVKEGNITGEVHMKINLYRIKTGANEIKAPGIVPGLLSLMEHGLIKPIDGEVEEELNKFLREVGRVGGRVSPISGGLLKQTSKTKFTYYLGEISAPNHVIDGLKKRHGNTIWLGGAPAYRGVKVNFYANLPVKKMYMSISILPFSPPATVVLNYPPFNLLPISALYYEREPFLRYQVEREVATRAKKIGLEIGPFHRDLSVLGDASVTFEEIKSMLKDGYPKIDKLEKAMHKVERLGTVADLVSMTIGDVYKVDKLLVSLLEPKVRAKEKVASPKEETEVEKEEGLDELEDILL